MTIIFEPHSQNVTNGDTRGKQNCNRRFLVYGKKELYLCGMRPIYPENYLKQLRNDRNLTVNELAETVGVSHSLITMLENRSRGFSRKTLHNIAQALNCHPEEIINGPNSVEYAQNEQEREALKRFRVMEPAAQEMFLHTLRTFQTSTKGDKTES